MSSGRDSQVASGFLLTLAGVWLVLQTIIGDLPRRLLSYTPSSGAGSASAKTPPLPGAGGNASPLIPLPGVPPIHNPFNLLGYPLGQSSAAVSNAAAGSPNGSGAVA